MAILQGTLMPSAASNYVGNPGVDTILGRFPAVSVHVLARL